MDVMHVIKSTPVFAKDTYIFFWEHYSSNLMEEDFFFFLLVCDWFLGGYLLSLVMDGRESTPLAANCSFPGDGHAGWPLALADTSSLHTSAANKCSQGEGKSYLSGLVFWSAF